MSSFHYTAIDKNGKQQKGVIQSESSKLARQLLREKKLIPLKIQATQPTLFWQRKTLSHKELVLITRQLATLLTAGMPLADALAAAAEQTEKSRSRSIILSVRSKVTEGYAFAQALEDFPGDFSALYCATAAAGERSGHLDVVLQRLADYLEQQLAMRQKIQHALIYPSMMIVVSLCIVSFLLEYIVPKMVDVYRDTHQALPSLTQILIAISAGLHTFGLYLLLLVGTGLFFFRRALKNNKILQEKFHHFLLKIPLLGYAIKTINTARFAKTLAILSASGLPIIDAMHVSAKLITALPIQKSIMAGTRLVQEGSAIHLALKQSRFFSPLSIHLIASGEASGQLEAMLERAANNQDKEITHFIETGLRLFEPFIILLMGAVVLFIVLAVLLPIFQLDQLA